MSLIKYNDQCIWQQHANDYHLIFCRHKTSQSFMQLTLRKNCNGINKQDRTELKTSRMFSVTLYCNEVKNSYLVLSSPYLTCLIRNRTNLIVLLHLAFFVSLINVFCKSKIIIWIERGSKLFATPKKHNNVNRTRFQQLPKTHHIHHFRSFLCDQTCNKIKLELNWTFALLIIICLQDSSKHCFSIFSNNNKWLHGG
jgi:hypothetical protein